MKRAAIAIVTILVLVAPGIASARTYGSPGSMADGEYKYVENPDGTFTEYYRSSSGTIARGSTYSNTGMAEADRMVRQTSTDAGTSGQTGSSVGGADSQDIYASEHILEDLRTGKPYVTPGEAAVGDEIVVDAEAAGTLPSFTAVAGAMAGAASAAAALWVGVEIGDGLDELVGWPTLNVFGSGTDPAEVGGLKTRLSASWLREVEIGKLKKCHEVAPTIFSESSELCFRAGGAYNKKTEYFSGGKWEVETKRVPSSAGEYAESGGIPITEEGQPCPTALLPISCYSKAPENFNFYQYFSKTPPARHMFPDTKKTVEEFDTTKHSPSEGVPAQKPVTTPIPVPSPTEVPAPAKHYVIEKGKNEEGKPVVTPIEPGEEIPSPTDPEVPAVSPNELYTTYKTALESAGFTDIEENVLPETQINTSVGPNDVSSVAPSPGSRVAPSTPVRVDVNPPNSPNPPGGGAGGGTTCGLTPPSASLDTTPLTDQKWSELFPFSMVIFAKEALSGLVTEPERPNQGFFVFGKEVGNLEFLSHFDAVIGIWRDCLAFLLTVAAALFLWRRTLGS